ncbi:MAG: FAD-dependent oxidoreductase [Acetobacteraceae bacterium]
MAPSGTTQRYVDIPREPPEERAVQERLHDFQEIADRFSEPEARRQASRCEQCGVPYCHVYCPLHNNIPDWLRLTAEGRFEEAYRLAESTNNLPEICGRICPQDRLCEAKWACTLEQAGHGTVTIGAVEQFLGDMAFEKGWAHPRLPKVDRPQHVGIVGAGPAGLAAAEELRALGYAVTLYDRHGLPGGLLRFGIPGFKLEKKIIARRGQHVLDAGVRVVGGFALGRDATLAELAAGHDAILLALGAYRPNRAVLPGAAEGTLVDGLTYLLASMQEPGAALPDGVDPARVDASGRRVIVIGGGDTAMDCVRTALRQGCVGVICLYRRGELDRSGSRRELKKAQAEGVQVLWQTETELYLPNTITMVEAAAGACMVDEGGCLVVRRNNAAGREIERKTIATDLVISAIGSQPDLPPAYGADGLAADGNGVVQVDPETGATNLPGVFAAGDLSRGPSLAVWAIRDGRAAAAGIHGYLNARDGAASGKSDARGAPELRILAAIP